MRQKIPAPPNEPLTMRILISYWYFKDVDVGAMIRKLQDLSGIEKMDVFADSGAFTAQSSGVHIELSEYVEWIHKWEEYLTIYLNLDVIGDQEGTNNNQRLLEEKFGVHPVPVFTFQRKGSDYEGTLRRQLDKYEFIALGGMVPFMGRPKQVMPHIIKCHKMAKGRTVFHGLGCTNWEIMKAIPFYSVDSSSWVGGVRYGNLTLFDEKWGRWRRFKLGEPRSFLGAGHLFELYGYDMKKFMHRETQNYHDIAAAQAVGYMMAERWLRRHHGLIQMPSNMWPAWGAIDPKHEKIGEVIESTNREDGVRFFPWVRNSMDEMARKSGELNSGMKLYLANIVDYLYDDAACHLGNLKNAPETKVFLADSVEAHFPAIAKAQRSFNEGMKLFLASTTNPDRFMAAAGGG